MTLEELLEKYNVGQVPCGAHVGPGWIPLLAKLFDELATGIGKANGFVINGNIVQIKEKFGGLRFYVRGAPKLVLDLIHEYEIASQRICETCGAIGELNEDSYWVRTLCDSCAKERRAER